LADLVVLWKTYEQSAERARDILSSGVAFTFLLFQIL
jgi:hypothetical protein